MGTGNGNRRMALRDTNMQQKGARFKENKSTNNLICFFGNFQGTCNLRCPPSVNNPVVPDQIADHTEGIMQAPFCLLDNLWRVGTDRPMIQNRVLCKTPFSKDLPD